jgi:anti-anti-sigma factor
VPSSEPDVAQRDGVVVVSATADVDVATASAFQTFVLGAVTNHAYGVVLDLTRATYVDSAGIRVLFTVADRLRRRQQALRLVVPPDAVLRRVLGVVELDAAVPVDLTVEAAVAAINAGEAGADDP